MSLYLLLNIGSILFPLIFTFHPKIKFYKNFSRFIPASILAGLIYIVWDIIFTKNGVWGFNPKYLLGVNLFNLPIEEWLFFFCIPYACIFTLHVFEKNVSKFRLSRKATYLISIVILTILVLLASLNFDRSYTFINSIFTFAILLISILFFPDSLRRFFPVFLIILVPFFLINGTLTGSFIDEPIVWYNNSENLGIRIFTIPVEDIFYAFGMLQLNVLFINLFTKNETLVTSPQTS